MSTVTRPEINAAVRRCVHAADDLLRSMDRVGTLDADEGRMVGLDLFALLGQTLGVVVQLDVPGEGEAAGQIRIGCGHT